MGQTKVLLFKKKTWLHFSLRYRLNLKLFCVLVKFFFTLVRSESFRFFLFDDSPHCNKYAVDKMFEIKHGWSGLLVEGNPLQFALCNMTGRKAWQVQIVRKADNIALFCEM